MRLDRVDEAIRRTQMAEFAATLRGDERHASIEDRLTDLESRVSLLEAATRKVGKAVLMSVGGLSAFGKAHKK